LYFFDRVTGPGEKGERKGEQKRTAREKAGKKPTPEGGFGRSNEWGEGIIHRPNKKLKRT